MTRTAAVTTAGVDGVAVIDESSRANGAGAAPAKPGELPLKQNGPPAETAAAPPLSHCPQFFSPRRSRPGRRFHETIGRLALVIQPCTIFVHSKWADRAIVGKYVFCFRFSLA